MRISGAKARRATLSWRHGRLGIASLLASVLALSTELALIGAAGLITIGRSGGEIDRNSATTMILILGLLGGAGIGVIGLGLGVAGWLTSTGNKLFSVLGTALNAAILAALAIWLVVAL